MTAPKVRRKSLEFGRRGFAFRSFLAALRLHPFQCGQGVRVGDLEIAETAAEPRDLALALFVFRRSRLRHILVKVEKLIADVMADAAQDAKNDERTRCSKLALHCRNEWLKIKHELEHDIVIAAEVIEDLILKGVRTDDVTKKDLQTTFSSAEPSASLPH